MKDRQNNHPTNPAVQADKADKDAPKDEALLCNRCGVPLQPIRTQFSYLKHSFHTDVPRCPRCGQVFIREDLAKGRMAEVESSLEDK